tara:strand:+ start:1432 stop:1836 length:405 start_codon:yes stop_codon:yes gene_type:complete
MATIAATVSLSVGDTSVNGTVSLTGPVNAGSDQTDFITGTQTVDADDNAYLVVAGSQNKLGGVDGTSCNVLVFLRNDNTTGGDLKVSVDNDDNYYIFIKPEQTNIITVTDAQDLRVESSTGNVTFTYLLVQVGT